MELRDAVESDADRLAELTDTPRDVMVNLVHDRTVRVAVESTDGEDDEDDEDKIQGFVSYDAREDTVHVTQLEGEPAVCDRLLEEPIRFAEREGMAVELLVPEDETDTRSAAEGAGFEAVGSGPTFEGQPTVRLRLDPVSA